MNGGRLEHGRLAGEQRMFAAGVAQQNAPREAELAAPRIGAHLAAGGRDRDLQSPAAAEERHAGGKYGLGELDLARHRRAAVVDVERRSGHRDAVVAARGRRPAENGLASAAVTISMCSAGSIRRSTRA
jgi:hypothetical protein